LERRLKQEAYFGEEVKAGGLFWAGGYRRLILGRRLKFSDKNSLTCHSYGG